MFNSAIQNTIEINEKNLTNEIILMVSGSLTLIALLATFIVSAGFTLYQKRKSLNFEMSVQYFNFMKKRRRINDKLLKKIKSFEMNLMKDYLLIGGESYNLDIDYSTEINYRDLKKLSKNRVLRKIIKKKNFVYYSGDFSKFIENSCISIKSKEQELAESIYKAIKMYPNVEELLIDIENRKKETFNNEELKVYELYVKETSEIRDEIWNLAGKIPGWKDCLSLYLAYAYIVAITLVGIINPLYFSFKVQESLLVIIFFTLVITLFIPISIHTVRHKKKLSDEISRFYL